MEDEHASVATMRIGEVAERTALSFRSLRHWDDVGLVQPSARTEGGFRLYTEKDVERILIIRRMKPLGYTLDEMRELLDVVDALTVDPSDVALRARIDDIRDGADQRRQKLTEQLAMADEFVQLLGQL
ncbi:MULTISPECIES: MerR family transcriptional regulator [Microbacterium]|uniref:MerR family transcriptional regulator n=1 Tax=Microbacterium TaxID=33882 RepID=UPI0029AFA5FB|nr:MerR family transcriptional regulator [Microbacterium algeriense]MDX2399117.1 MerR family transcriptional regulator [Microbacterium algeriense]